LGNGLKIWIPVITVAILSISIVSISAEESLIPSWIKTIAGFWATDQISDSEFLSALQYLLDNGILKTKQTATEPIPTITQSTPTITQSTPTITKQVKQYYPALEDFELILICFVITAILL